MKIAFDPHTREIVVTSNDFATVLDASAQRGGIIQDSRCAILRKPMIGIGLEEVINADLEKANYEMNRWKTQVREDGGKTVNFNITQDKNNVSIITNVKY